jgi:dephospho-CoA kinase
MYDRRPIIGVVGGIGSGKSLVADEMGRLGAGVIRADDAVRAAYSEAEVREMLRQWWGSAAFFPTGEVDRGWIAGRIFSNSQERARLEHLLHPKVDAARWSLMGKMAHDSHINAFAWDIPLLVETDLYRLCDSVVYVDADLATRAGRVARSRGWDAAELVRRENSQIPLDRKREISDHVVNNSASADVTRGQVEDVFSRILAQWTS